MRRVYLDSCMVIYLLENVGELTAQTKQFLARNSDSILCVSPLVRLEVLVKPLRDGVADLVSNYEDFMAAQNWLAIDDSIVAHALELRVQHGLKTPDALHLATAIHHGCTEFWTNDNRLNKVASNLTVNVLAN